MFVQISDANTHRVRELLDDIFGSENHLSIISYVTTSDFPSTTISRAGDCILWYAKNSLSVKYHQLYRSELLGDDEAGDYKWALLPDGTTRGLTRSEQMGLSVLPDGARPFRYGPLTSSGASDEGSKPFTFAGKSYSLGLTNHWKVTAEGLKRLEKLGLLISREYSLAYRLFLDSYPVVPINNNWVDTKWRFNTGDKAYVVQTNAKIIQRCILMTTDPGDLVLDPTYGSGITAYVAEQWGRRWMTVDVSRVQLALARQRLLTATFNWYALRDEKSGPANGFVYKRKKP